MGNNKDEQVQNLLDREAIRTLVANYCRVVWEGDIDAYPLLYTEDGVLSYITGGEPPIQGHAALRDMIAKVITNHRPRHFVHNHVVELLGPDRAKGWCCLQDYAWLGDDGDGLLVMSYDDDYVKVDDQWKFNKRQVTMEYMGRPAEYRVPKPLALEA